MMDCLQCPDRWHHVNEQPCATCREKEPERQLRAIETQLGLIDDEIEILTKQRLALLSQRFRIKRKMIECSGKETSHEYVPV